MLDIHNFALDAIAFKLRDHNGKLVAKTLVNLAKQKEIIMEQVTETFPFPYYAEAVSLSNEKQAVNGEYVYKIIPIVSKTPVKIFIGSAGEKGSSILFFKHFYQLVCVS